jgi:prepilin-type N-terminal cleavage/methylation domain-containing protein
MLNQRLRQVGFTLPEVLIVVIILAILVGVAIPTYQRTIDRNYRQQAQDILTTIYYGERAYRLGNGTYVTVPATKTWADIFLDDPHTGGNPITFVVGSAGANAFTATATRNGGACGTKTVTINESRTIAGSWLACN